MWIQDRTSERERKKLMAWWTARKLRAKSLGKTPVRWKPRGKLRWPSKKK